jgi:octaprenyl-diphosphate synthase
MQLPAHTDISGSMPWSGMPAFRLIDCQLDQVRELINQQLTTAAKPGEIKPLLDYVSSRTGKMIRPGLVLLSYRAMCNATCEKEKNDSYIRRNNNTRYVIRNTQYETIRVAAIIEMIHNATLLHDDVIDDGQLRRGLPSANHLWGNESAVLLGDYVLGRVFQACADLEPTIAGTIATIALRVCEGELRQVIQRQNWHLSEEEYIEIITEKSAAFFSGCCRLGALLAQAEEDYVQMLARFGLNAGIAFQITDDLLDITGEESRTGKTVGSDASKSKLTIAIIHLIKTVDETESRRLYNMLDTPEKSQNTLTEMLKSHGSLDYARNRAQQFVKKAIEELQSLAQSEAKTALIETAKFMAARGA